MLFLVPLSHVRAIDIERRIFSVTIKSVRPTQSYRFPSNTNDDSVSGVLMVVINQPVPLDSFYGRLTSPST